MKTQLLTAALLVLSSAATSYAHFPWLTINADGKVALYFGENIADQTYKLPESIGKAAVKSLQDGKSDSVSLTKVDSEKFVGLNSQDKVADGTTLVSQVTYGVYHGAKLDYYMAHLGGKLPTEPTKPSEKQPLDLFAQVVDTDSGVDVYVLWKGKPLADVDVTLFCEEGHEEGKAKTDSAGKVSFTDRQVEEGLNGILVGHTEKGVLGKVGDEAYDANAHYLTVTFADPE